MKVRLAVWDLLLLANIGLALQTTNTTISLLDERDFPPKYDPASFQLSDWAKAHSVTRATGENGIPLASLTASLGIGRRGPLLLQDINFQEHLASFDRERIPERVVHARGSGALGYFVVTSKEATKYTRARLFGQVGKRTRLAVRFSTVFREAGSADTENDIRGFAVKFYTEEGNWDLAGISTVTFGVRDPLLFPSFARSRKRNPATHLPDYNMFWDFAARRPETTFQTLLMFSDAGFPANYRHIDGFSVNTFRMTGGTGGEPVFVRFHLISNQGKRILRPETFGRLAGSDPDHFTRDLYNAIQRKQFPSWVLNIQVMTMRQAKEFKYNPFDPTKMFPTADFPLLPLGKLVLNRNPVDYFNQVEQIAFNPGSLVPGIEPSPDRLLHGRIFSYGDSQGYRVGKNRNQLPINRPLKGVHTYTRDGSGSIDANGLGDPNYYPNSYNGPEARALGHQAPFTADGGTVDRTDTGDEDNHEQVAQYWAQEMSLGERKRTIRVLAAHLSRASPRIQEESLRANWDPISDEFSLELRAALVLANARKVKEIRKSGKKDLTEAVG